MEIKKTIVRDELEKEINLIWGILEDAKRSFNYSNYFYKPPTSEEIAYVNESIDINYIREALWRLTIIELAKLFSKSMNDKYCLNILINKLKKDNEYIILGLTPEIISNWEIKIKECKKIIKKLNTLRNKKYAHTDNDLPDESEMELSYKDIEELILIVEKVIVDIHATIFNAYTDFYSPFFDKNKFNMIKILAQDLKKRREDNQLKRIKRL